MKKVLLLFVLVLIAQGCSRAEIGPYATDDFNHKYSAYVDFYNMAVYSSEGLGAWMDEYDLTFHAEGEAHFENPFVGVDLSTFTQVEQYAREQVDKQPALQTLDELVRQITQKSEAVRTLMAQVQEYYAHQHFTEDDYAFIRKSDPILQQGMDELEPMFTRLEQELIAIRKEADAQLITRYTTSGDDLSAELVRVMSLYDAFSEQITRYMLDEPVDFTRYEQDIAQADASRTQMLTLSENERALRKANRTKEQIDQFADNILQGDQVLRHMLGTMKAGNELVEDDLMIFETVFNSMVEQMNQVNE